MRNILILLAICSFTVSAQAGTFKDNFDDGDFDGWTVANIGGGTSEWKVENGEAICKRPGDWISVLKFGEVDWKNYTIEFDAKIVQILSGYYALAFDLRLKADLEVVWCGISGPSGGGISLWLNGAAARESFKAFKIELDRWYHLKGVADGDNFTLYVDGELIMSMSDPRIPNGRVAIGAHGAVAHFDNVVITGDDVPDNSNAVYYQDKLANSWGQIKSQQ